MASAPIQFVTPPGDLTAEDRMQFIAIQATAVMLQSWFEEEDPSPEEAKVMIETVVKALRGRTPIPV